MTQLFANNAASKLGSGISSSALTLTLKAGDGAKFPSPSGGDFFLATLYQKVGQDEINHEIVKCTARSGDVLTVMRAQEGTTARAFGVDDPVELRLTAGSLTTIAPYRGTQLYTTSQTISKSTFGTATYVLVELWGGGGSGSAVVSTTTGTYERAGGEGGEYVQVLLRVASLAASEPLVIGSGGAAVVSTSNTLVPGNPGGDTSFAGVVAPGGLGAPVTNDGPSKVWLAGKNGGDGGGTTPSAKTTTARLVSGPGGSSVNGGGGGGGSTPAYNTPGTSTGGGNGGAGLTSTTSPAVAESGAVPSGGGGGVRLNLSSGTATSGAGARGQVRLTWW